MSESDRAKSWLSDPEKMEELARRLFYALHPQCDWDALFLREKSVWEDRARRVVHRTIEVVKLREAFDEDTSADDVLNMIDKHNKEEP